MACLTLPKVGGHVGRALAPVAGTTKAWYIKLGALGALGNRGSRAFTTLAIYQSVIRTIWVWWITRDFTFSEVGRLNLGVTRPGVVHGILVIVHYYHQRSRGTAAETLASL